MRIQCTVPASFNCSQRQAAQDARAVAGLNVVRLIIGSTAAHGLEIKTKAGQHNLVVLDLGGGTLEINEVLATAGDPHLDGEDFDGRLVEHCLAEFKRMHHKDLQPNALAMRRLRVACARAKRELLTSESGETQIELDALHEGIDFEMTFTQSVISIQLFEGGDDDKVPILSTALRPQN